MYIKKKPYLCIMNSKHFNTVVFDLGGVIIDLNVPRCVAAFTRLMGEANVRNILGMDNEGEGVVAVSAATKQLMHDFEYGTISAEQFLDSVLTYCYAGTTAEQVREAWMSMLGELPQERLDYILSLRKAGYHTILLSNTNELHWEPLLEQYPLADCFDRMFASQLLHMAKPNRDIYEHVVRETGIDCARTVYVDDLEKNRKAGEQFAGWTTVESIDALKGLIDHDC